jgi:hypothetical protein
MTAAEIMIGARVLIERWDVEHYEARSIVRDVLKALRAALSGNVTLDHPCPKP